MFFKVKSGLHKDGDKVYKVGSLIESDKDLSQIFKNKFEKVETKTEVITPNKGLTPSLPSVDIDKGAGEPSTPASKSNEQPNSDFGKDITKQFPKAKEIGCKVFEKQNKLFLLDEVDGEILNAEPLNKDEIDKFIKQYLEK